jgi:hypothetical protein
MKYTLFFLLTLALLGCESKSIVPLKVGNNWRYHWAHFNLLGDTLLRQENYISVIKDTAIASERWYMIRTNYGDTISTESFAINRSDGLYRFFRLSLTPRLDLPYPANVGTTVVRRDTFDSGLMVSLDSAYVESTNKSVTVPAGTFNSYLYHRTNIFTKTMDSYVYRDTSSSEEYYTPGVGLVLGLYGKSKSEGKPNEEVLIDYKVN